MHHMHAMPKRMLMMCTSRFIVQSAPDSSKEMPEKNTQSTHAHVHTHIQREREGKRERDRDSEVHNFASKSWKAFNRVHMRVHVHSH